MSEKNISPELSQSGTKPQEKLDVTTDRKLDGPSVVANDQDTTESLDTDMQEALGFVKKYCMPDIDGLLDLAIPDDNSAKEVASVLGMGISALIENLLVGHRTRSSGSKSADIIRSWIPGQESPLSAKAETETTAALLGQCFDTTTEWLTQGGGIISEGDLFTQVSHFISFVAGCIKAVHVESSPLAHPERLLVPACKSNAKGPGNCDISLVDHYSAKTLVLNSEQYKETLPNSVDTFALVAVKAAKQGISKALPELFRYTRDIYAGQYNRRFVWGLAVGGKQVQVLFFGPNYALASHTMNMDEPDGRARLVKLLVNWSFCQSHRLGYDPTVTYNNELKCYEIMADNREGTPTTYYSSGVTIKPDRLFGRRTRCFTASTTKPAPGVEIEPDIFIKDAWVEATEHTDDDKRDECRYLKSIAKMLDEVDGLDGKCPKFHGGGRVTISRIVAGRSVETVEDTGRSILNSSICKQLANKTAPPLRVHKRICVHGIGKPLKLVDNVFELICVVADVMECHWNIYEHCGIFHRDISVNNIMFTGCGSNIKGMLIDFDHSIYKDDMDAVHNFKQSGTFPFMSINNLEGSTREYSVLEDWESFIYNLCWIGVYGWKKTVDVAKKPNSPKGAQQDQQEYKRISRWEQNNLYECADNKRTDLHSEELFYQITSQFDKSIPSVGCLKQVVCKLRKTLIDDHKDERLQGSVKKLLQHERQNDSSVLICDGQHADPQQVDPFDERARETADAIAKRLVSNVMEAARQARAHLKKQEEQCS